MTFSVVAQVHCRSAGLRMVVLRDISGAMVNKLDIGTTRSMRKHGRLLSSLLLLVRRRNILDVDGQ
jgi:hypothetical protein